jgi:hypothetical protein
MRRTLLWLALASCGPIELRIDETKGVPSLKGQTEVAVDTTFTCGQSLMAGTKAVATRVVSGGCEFTFDDSLSVLKPEDYGQIPELKTATNLVQRFEFSLKKLDLIDGTDGSKLDLSTRVTSVVMSINGQQVADKAALANLPFVVKLEGAALSALKAKIDQRAAASVTITSVAVLPNTPKPPARLKVDYEVQPAVILGPGSVKLP